MSRLLMTPFLPRIVIHAKLRITEFVNNGNSVNAIRIPRHFFDTPEMTYAAGKPKTAQKIVTIKEILSVRPNTAIK